MTKDKDDAVQRRYDAISDEEQINQHLIAVQQAVVQQYNKLFDSVLYDDATLDRFGAGRLSVARCNLLIDDAMAILGSPHYRTSRTNWSQTAYKFLAQFTKGE